MITLAVFTRIVVPPSPSCPGLTAILVTFFFVDLWARERILMRKDQAGCWLELISEHRAGGKAKLK